MTSGPAALARSAWRGRRRPLRMPSIMPRGTVHASYRSKLSTYWEAEDSAPNDPSMNRDDFAEMISLAERLLAVGEPCALATLFAVDGSSYRPLGSMMLAGPSATLSAGGISGGCLEDYIIRRG